MKVNNMPIGGGVERDLSDLKNSGQAKPSKSDKLANKSDKEIIDALVGGTSRRSKSQLSADVKAVLKPKSQWPKSNKAPTLAQIEKRGLYGLKRPQAYDNAGDLSKKQVSQIRSAIKEAFGERPKRVSLDEIRKNNLYGSIQRPQADDTAQRVANIESALAEAFAKVDTSKLA